MLDCQAVVPGLDPPLLVGRALPLLAKEGWRHIADPSVDWTDLVADSIAAVAVRCLSPLADDRPSAIELVDELQQLEWTVGAQRSYQTSCAPEAGEAELSDADVRECVVCMENPPNARLVDCGHAVVCVECAQVLVEQQFGCPLCRSSISQTGWEQGSFNATFTKVNVPIDGGGACADAADVDDGIKKPPKIDSAKK